MIRIEKRGRKASQSSATSPTGDISFKRQKVNDKRSEGPSAINEPYTQERSHVFEATSDGPETLSSTIVHTRADISSSPSASLPTPSAQKSAQFNYPSQFTKFEPSFTISAPMTSTTFSYPLNAEVPLANAGAVYQTSTLGGNPNISQYEYNEEIFTKSNPTPRGVYEASARTSVSDPRTTLTVPVNDYSAAAGYEILSQIPHASSIVTPTDAEFRMEDHVMRRLKTQPKLAAPNNHSSPLFSNHQHQRTFSNQPTPPQPFPDSTYSSPPRSNPYFPLSEVHSREQTSPEQDHLFHSHSKPEHSGYSNYNA